MIKIFFTQTQALANAETFEERLRSLPSLLQQKILSYNNQQKRIHSLCGLLLVKKMLDFFELKENISQLQYDKKGKPYFDNPLHFSISYAKNTAVCAGTLEGNIGIDTEQVQALDLSLYQPYFTLKEWKRLNEQKDPYQQFFEYWTRKEAVLKAAGTGIISDLQLIDVTNDTVVFEGVVYYLQKVVLDDNYVCNTGCTFMQEMEVREVNFTDL